MPQLDQSIYLSQTSWLIGLFCVYYIILKGGILPKVLEKIYIKKELTKKQSKNLTVSDGKKFYKF